MENDSKCKLYELEATVAKFTYYKKDKNGNVFVELGGEGVVKIDDEEYNVLKVKSSESTEKNNLIRSAKVTEQYTLDGHLINILSLLFANKSKATFTIEEDATNEEKKAEEAKYKIIAVEIKS